MTPDRLELLADPIERMIGTYDYEPKTDPVISEINRARTYALNNDALIYELKIKQDVIKPPREPAGNGARVELNIELFKDGAKTDIYRYLSFNMNTTDTIARLIKTSFDPLLNIIMNEPQNITEVKIIKVNELEHDIKSKFQSNPIKFSRFLSLVQDLFTHDKKVNYKNALIEAESLILNMGYKRTSAGYELTNT